MVLIPTPESLPQIQDRLPQVKSDEFLPSISRWITIGGGAIGAVCGAAALWAAMTPYATVVKASGNVRPTGEIRLVQAVFEGTVATVMHQVGDTVQAGEVIAVLAKPELPIQQQQLRQTIQNQQQQQDQIDSQIRSLNQQILAEIQLKQQTIAAAEATLVSNQQDSQERQTMAQTQVDEAIANLDLAQVEMEKYQELANQGAIAQLQAQAKAQAFKVAQAKLDRAKINLAPHQANIDMATAQIGQSQAKGESTIAVLAQEKNNLQNQKLTLQQQINHNQKELEKLRQTISQQTLTAPITGKILHLDLRNPGQVIKSGDTIAKIVPTATELEIKVKVPAGEIAKVKVCQSQSSAEPQAPCPMGEVLIRVDAYPYPDYGLLPGVVRDISADAIHHDREEPYYEATIVPRQNYLQRQGQHYWIQPGMSVTAEIVSKQDTVLSFLLKQARLTTRI